MDITTGTFGKALGGASGGYVAARQEIVDLLRQRARPYLFSNTLAPAIIAGTIEALKLVTESGRAPAAAGVERRAVPIADGGCRLRPAARIGSIVPVMFGDAALTARIADALQERGVYVTAFSYPVVPKGRAHPGAALGGAHRDEVRRCVAAFADARDAVLPAA